LIIDLKSIGQIGIVVEDLEKSMNVYWEGFGIGPWNVWTFASPVLREMTYYGKPTLHRFRIAEASVGDLHLELLMHIDGDTVYRDFLKKRGPGLHHVSIYTDDIEPMIEKFRRVNINVIQSGKLGKDTYCYFDTEPIFGIILEAQTTYYDVPPERIYPEKEKASS